MQITGEAPPRSEHLWWQRGIVYQVYPRSFQDSNADDVGDLPGIIDRLDYLKSLNVDVVWISPIYPSPSTEMDRQGSEPLGRFRLRPNKGVVIAL